MCNSKQLLLPRQEFTIATFEGRITCHSKGKSGLERALWSENFMCPKAGQLKQNDWEPPCEVSLSPTELFPLLLSCPFGGGQNVPKAREQGGKAEELESRVCCHLESDPLDPGKGTQVHSRELRHPCMAACICNWRWWWPKTEHPPLAWKHWTRVRRESAARGGLNHILKSFGQYSFREQFSSFTVSFLWN